MALSGRLPGRSSGGPPYPRRHECGRVRRPGARPGLMGSSCCRDAAEAVTLVSRAGIAVAKRPAARSPWWCFGCQVADRGPRQPTDPPMSRTAPHPRFTMSSACSDSGIGTGLPSRLPTCAVLRRTGGTSRDMAQGRPHERGWHGRGRGTAPPAMRSTASRPIGGEAMSSLAARTMSPANHSAVRKVWGGGHEGDGWCRHGQEWPWKVKSQAATDGRRPCPGDRTRTRTAAKRERNPTYRLNTSYVRGS